MEWKTIDERALGLAHYLIETNDTIRNAARKFGVSKSTVHKDVAIRLKDINIDFYNEVRQVLDKNKAERHLRGGLATKKKYERESISSK